MSENDLVAVVRAVLQIAKDHWLRYGTPTRPEDAELVTADVRRLLTASQPPPKEQP